MIASVTTNRDLQNVLAATSLLYGGIKNKSTFYEHAMINNSYLESAYVSRKEVCKSVWN